MMTSFTVHDETTAPDASKPLLANSKAAFGMIPNLHGVMAESAQMLEAYQRVHELFQNSGFDADELTVIWQTINVENNCHYCVPAHSAVAAMMKVDPEINNAVVDGKPLASEKLEALRSFTLKIVRDRGVLDDASVQAFLDAGYTKSHILGVILGYAQKVMSNYTNHMADTPVDTPFQKFAR